MSIPRATWLYYEPNGGAVHADGAGGYATCGALIELAWHMGPAPAHGIDAVRALRGARGCPRCADRVSRAAELLGPVLQGDMAAEGDQLDVWVAGGEGGAEVHTTLRRHGGGWLARCDPISGPGERVAWVPVAFAPPAGLVLGWQLTSSAPASLDEAPF